MDPFRPVDWGAYYFFDFVIKHHPGLLPLVVLVNSLSGLAPTALLSLLAATVSWRRQRPGAALVNLALFAAAFVVVELIRTQIARPRPDDADILVGPDDMLGSYPARSVFLFTMAALQLTLVLWEQAGRRERMLFGLSAAFLIIAVCMSQLLLRLHFVTDVVGGLLGGSACALQAHLLCRPRSPTPAPGAITNPDSVPSARESGR